MIVLCLGCPARVPYGACLTHSLLSPLELSSISRCRLKKRPRAMITNIPDQTLGPVAYMYEAALDAVTLHVHAARRYPDTTRCLCPLPWTIQISGFGEYCVCSSTMRCTGRAEPSGIEPRSHCSGERKSRLVTGFAC